MVHVACSCSYRCLKQHCEYSHPLFDPSNPLWFFLSVSTSVFHHSCRNVTFHYRRSSAAYFGGMCSSSRGVGVNEVCLTWSVTLSTHIKVCVSVWLQLNNPWFLLCSQYGNSLAMAGSLSQSLAQNLGIQWDPASKRSIHENTCYLIFSAKSTTNNRKTCFFCLPLVVSGHADSFPTVVELVHRQKTHRWQRKRQTGNSGREGYDIAHRSQLESKWPKMQPC